MESRIQVSSQDAVDQNYDRLSLLDVRQCAASSQADKQMIMAKISNVEVFNRKIQQLVFSEEMGLFSQRVDGNERSRQVERIVRHCSMRAEVTKDKPGPKKGNDTFETEPSDPPVYSWARGGMFIYKGTKESLNNEVLAIEVLGQKGGAWAPQGKALVGLRGAIDYPIAVGVVKILTTSKNDYVQGRAGGSISMAMRSLALKPGQNDEDSSVPRPMQDLTSLTMYYIQGSVQHLVVTVNGADGLPVADPDYGSSNPFVRVKYDGTVEQSPVMASLAPCWNHTFYIPVRFIDPCIYKDKAYKKNIFPEELVESFCPELWPQMSRTAISARTVALHKTGRSFAVIQGLALDAFDSLDDRQKLACAARQIQDARIQYLVPLLPPLKSIVGAMELCDRGLELIRASSVHEEEEEDETPEGGGEADLDSDLGEDEMLLTLLKICTSMSFSAASDSTSAIRQEMKSKGFLDIEVWHWDGVPTEFLGAFKLDLQKTRFGQQVERALCRDVVKTKQVENTTDEADREKDDTGDATVGIDPALAKVHNTLMYEGRREKITGSSLATMATPTISFDCYFLPDFKPEFSNSFPDQDQEDIASEQLFAPAYKRWKEVFSELHEAYQIWFPDSPPKRRWTSSFTNTEGKVLPLPRLITPLALPADLGSPLAIMHWIKCIEYNAPARQRACGQINLWQTPSDILALRRGSVQDHAVLLCCALQGLKKDAWVCVGSVEGGNEHTWVMTREGYGTITFWEVTTGAKYHLGQRWLGKSGDQCIPQVDKRFKDRQAMAEWKADASLQERANFSRLSDVRQQHLQGMDQLTRLPVAPWPELCKKEMLAAIPYLSIEVIFNGYDVYGNLLNHHPACIYYDMEIDRNSWHSLAGSDLKQQMYLGKEVAIPVGPKVSSFTADTLEKNIENELKESIRMIRMRIGFESAYEDSEVRDEALRTYLGHLEKECVLDVDWAHDESDKPLKPWGAPSPFNAAEYKSSCRDAWKKHWKEKSDLKGARRYLAVKENHVLSGVPLHFSSSDLKEIRKCIMGCKPIQEYFRYPSDDIFFFAVAKVFPLPDSVCSVWVFMGAEVKMPRERIMQLCKEQKEAEAAMFEEEEQAMEGAEEEDIEDLEAPPEVKEEAPPPPPEVKDEGQDLYASAESDKKLEQLQQGKDDSKDDEKKTKKKDKESE
eukprot:s209_g16.t1